jgi:hypothetical protein
MKTVMKIALGLILGAIVLIVGCTALIGTAADEAIDELDREQRAHAIPKSAYDRMRIGMTEKQVVATAGKRPEDRQDFESEGILDSEPERSSCIYYNRAGGEFGDSFQLCFTDGRLDSKNAY